MPTTEIVRDGFTRHDLGDGVVRVSGTDLGKSLGYIPRKPSMFNKLVIERGLKGKFKDLDIVSRRLPCERGIKGGEKTEYYLSIEAALKVAGEVQTPAAREVRQKVVDDLMRLREPVAAIVTTAAEPPGLVEALERHTETLTATMTRLMADAIASIQKAALPPAAALPPVPSPFIDEPRVRALNAQARPLAKIRGSGVTDVWRGIREAERCLPGPSFTTVLFDRFGVVSDVLREQLAAAVRERDAKHATTNVRQHPSVVQVTASRLANPATDIGVQQAARRFSADLGYDVPYWALGRRGGIYDCSEVDVLHEAPRRRPPRSVVTVAAYLDESRYQRVLQWMRTNPGWVRSIINDPRAQGGR